MEYQKYHLVLAIVLGLGCTTIGFYFGYETGFVDGPSSYLDNSPKLELSQPVSIPDHVHGNSSEIIQSIFNPQLSAYQKLMKD